MPSKWTMAYQTNMAASRPFPGSGTADPEVAPADPALPAHHPGFERAAQQPYQETSLTAGIDDRGVCRLAAWLHWHRSSSHLFGGQIWARSVRPGWPGYGGGHVPGGRERRNAVTTATRRMQLS